jgi:phosphate acetyltransferase/phosphate butyryltransferase
MSECKNSPERIVNRTLGEIQIGESALAHRVLTKQDIELFAVVSGDVNPAHLDPEYAQDTPFHHVIAHGMWGGALISGVLGTKLPGPGTIYLGQSLRFRRPVAIGDCITTSVRVKSKNEQNGRVTLECHCVNQEGVVVIDGEAEVLAPRQKIDRSSPELPWVRLIEPDASALAAPQSDVEKGTDWRER